MENREQVEETAATWIARRDTGPWTEEDTQAFDAWLAQSAGNRAAYYRLNAAWQEAGRLRALAGTVATPSISPTPAAADIASKRKSLPLALAASVLLAIAAAWFLWPAGPSYKTAIGALASVPLEDGSRVTLNTDSKIRVAVTDTERRIDLERGEAFFEVAKDPNRPFIVLAGDQRIIAVGTQFSVRRDGDDTRVLVTEGTVRMEPVGHPGAESELLPAGTIARAQSDRVLVQTKPVSEIEQSLSWRTGVLTFRDTPLADAVAEFNRYNTRKIVIEDRTIATIQIGGIFRSTNLDPFVRLLEEGFPVRATEEGDHIVLTSAN